MTNLQIWFHQPALVLGSIKLWKLLLEPVEDSTDLLQIVLALVH
jgi:hypothetical protein